jgi:hypothetical protein
MPEYVYFTVVKADLEALGLASPSFQVYVSDETGEQGYLLRFQQAESHAAKMVQELTLAQATIPEAKQKIADEVRKLPKGGTVIVVEPREEIRPMLRGYVVSDVHMLPFDDGTKFNAARKRRNDWCPSAADWAPEKPPTSRFDRLDKDTI